jgi:putative cell wall-binding protein
MKGLRARIAVIVAFGVIVGLVVPASALAIVIPQRLEGANRYLTAVAIARDTYDPGATKNWGTSTNIIIASGEDRAAADPLAAAGLCWAYDAPLFLINSESVPWEVLVAIKEIYISNGPIDLHVVGGTTTIPQERIEEIRMYVNPNLGQVGDRRFTTGGDRYDLAASIAYYVDLEYQSQHGAGVHPWVLVANGQDPGKFFDALALSAVSAQNGFPILLVEHDAVPGATLGRYNAIGPPGRVIGGGPNTVDPAIELILNAGIEQRWWGQDRYWTARDIADNAVGWGMLSNARAGVASAMPDALTGGSAMGYGGINTPPVSYTGGPLLLTQPNDLPWASEAYLKNNKMSMAECIIFGGPVSVSPAIETEIGLAIN